MPVWVSVLFGLGMTALSFGALMNLRILYLSALLVLVLPLLVFFVHYPQIWLYSIVLSQVVWLGGGSRSVTILEIALAGYFLGGLLLWFAWQLGVKRQRLIRNGGDMLLLTTFVLSSLNAIVALAHDVNMMLWAREWLLWVLILYYFPLREHLKEDRHVRVFLWLLFAVFIYFGAEAFRTYLRATTDIAYAFELVSARSSLREIIFVTSAVCTTIILLYSRKAVGNVFFLGCSIFFIGVLIATFSRSFWVACVVGLGLIFMFVDQRRRIKMLILVSSGFVIGLSSVLVLVGEGKGELLIEVLENRALSIIAPTESISLQSRTSESLEVIELLSQTPFTGYGFGKEFNFYNPVSYYHNRTSFIHNGYLSIAFKIGLPLFLLFFAGLYFYLFRGIRTVRRTDDPFDKGMVLGATITLFVILFVSLFGNQFAFREGILIASIALAIIGRIDERYKEAARCLTKGDPAAL